MFKYFSLSGTIAGVIFYIGFIFFAVLSTALAKIVYIKYDVDVIQFLIYRTIICFLILLPFAIKDGMPFLKRKNILSVVGVGMHMFSIYAWYYTVKHTSLNIASIGGFIVPIFVSIFAIIFLNEKISKNLWITVFLCFGAVVLVNIEQSAISGSTNYFSYFLLFIFIISRSFAIIFGKKITLKGKRPMEMIYYICFSGVVLAPFMFFIMPFQLKGMSYQAWILEMINVALYLFQMFFMYKAYTFVDVSVLQPVEFTKFVFAVLISYFFLNEYATFIQIFAASVIFLANMIFMRKYV